MGKEILNEYVKLIDKGYCEECNELNCIDNFPHKKIASAISDLQLENTKLKGKLKKQQEIIDDCKEDISNLLDIIGKNCYELKCTSDEWLVIQKYQDKEV